MEIIKFPLSRTSTTKCKNWKSINYLFSFLFFFICIFYFVIHNCLLIPEWSSGVCMTANIYNVWAGKIMLRIAKRLMTDNTTGEYIGKC